MFGDSKTISTHLQLEKGAKKGEKVRRGLAGGVERRVHFGLKINFVAL